MIQLPFNTDEKVQKNSYCTYSCGPAVGTFMRLPHRSVTIKESFEACCQWALLNVQVITLLFPFTVQKYICPPVRKCMLGLFVFL